jgi:hypothetical protein
VLIGSRWTQCNRAVVALARRMHRVAHEFMPYVYSMQICCGCAGDLHQYLRRSLGKMGVISTAMLAGSAGNQWLRQAKKRVERVKGIEPSYEAWEASVLPLNYTRVRVNCMADATGDWAGAVGCAGEFDGKW